MCNPKDQQLAISFQQGDADAFTQVYQHYSDEVREYIRRYVPSNLRSEVDDICQYFWAQLHRYVYTYDPGRPIRNWIFASAAKAPSGYYKSIARKRTVNLIGRDYTSLADEQECCPTDHRDGPVDCAIFQEELKTVIDAMASIPQQFRQAIDAVYLHNQKPATYARENGIATGTVYTQLNRGLKHLRKALGVQSAVT